MSWILGSILIILSLGYNIIFVISQSNDYFSVEFLLRKRYELMVVLFQRLQVLVNGCRYVCATWYIVDRTNTLGTDAKTLLVLVNNRLDFNGELTDFSAVKWKDFQTVLEL